MEFIVDLHRFDEPIAQITAQPKTTGKIMLYGSSFFARWFYDRARQQLAEASGGALDVINHGFGGATVDELLYFYPRLVKPYAPSLMVIRAGYNEINKGQSPEAAVFLLERLLQWCAADNPGVRFLVLKVFDAKRPTQELYEKLQAYNALLEQKLPHLENVQVLDINSFFYADPGHMGDRSKLRDVFVEDGLHLTDAAYQELSEYLSSRILSAME